MGFGNNTYSFLTKVFNGIVVPEAKKNNKEKLPAFPDFYAHERKAMERGIRMAFDDFFEMTEDEEKVYDAFLHKGHVIKKENYDKWVEKQKQKKEENQLDLGR